MDKFDSFQDLAKKLAEAIPENVRKASEDIQQTFHSILQSGLHSMDLVTREQFDTQAAVLARTRKKLEALEKKVAELEQALTRKNK